MMKSVPIDYIDIIVFAIRGTQTFIDWTVNVQTKPKLPAGFLVSQIIYHHLPKILANSLLG